MVKDTVMFTRENLGSVLGVRQSNWWGSPLTSGKTNFLATDELEELGEAKFVWDKQVGTVYSSVYPYLQITLEGYLRYLHGVLSEYPEAVRSIATIEGAENIPFSAWGGYENAFLKKDAMLDMEVTLTVAREWASKTGVICTPKLDVDNSITILYLGYPQNSVYPALTIIKERGTFLWPQGNIGKDPLKGPRYVYVTKDYRQTLISFVGDTGGVHEA